MAFRLFCAWLGLGLCACTGSIEPNASADEQGTPGDAPSERGSGGGASLEGCAQSKPTPDSQLLRLSHAQYQNTVKDLLDVDIDVANEFISDADATGFDTAVRELSVSERLGRDYQRAAESLADAVVANSATLKKLLPCDPGTNTQACARAFITGFGLRAFRRPLGNEEVEAYFALHQSAAASYDGGDAFQNGVHMVLQTMLQAPDFLYRIGGGENATGAKTTALTSYEMASRLSFALWNRMPDEQLLDAASKDLLRSQTQIEAQARRMLDDPRGAGVLNRFHTKWLHAERFQGLSRDPGKYPAFAKTLESDLRAELDLFVNDVIIEGNQGITELLQAPQTFVNARLAAVYGLSGQFGNEFQRVEVEPTKRAGVLTQLGFLASHAHSNMTSPIERGVFVHTQILCTPIPAPPNDVDFNLPPPTADLPTTRARVDAHTAHPTCKGCHAIINPVGFAFENFDADGSYRTQEREHAIDAKGQLTLDEKSIEFDGASDLIGKIATSAQARQCYGRHWLRYLYGRNESSYDLCRLEALGKRAAATNRSTKDLIVQLVLDETFRNHTFEDVAP